jgi:hypothetical protein
MPRAYGDRDGWTPGIRVMNPGREPVDVRLGVGALSQMASREEYYLGVPNAEEVAAVMRAIAVEMKWPCRPRSGPDTKANGCSGHCERRREVPGPA